MSVAVRFSPEAQRDLRDAIRYYEREQEGLGRRFAQAIDNSLDEIVRHPESFAIMYRDVRHNAVTKFPYGIYFRLADELVWVVAVFHG